MDWEVEASVRCFLFVRSSGKALDIPASETTTVQKTGSEVQVKTWVGMVPISFKLGHRKTLAEAAHADSLVVDLSADFPDTSSDDPIVEEEIVEEDSTSDQRDLTSKNHRGLSASQRTQEL